MSVSKCLIMSLGLLINLEMLSGYTIHLILLELTTRTWLNSDVSDVCIVLHMLSVGKDCYRSSRWWTVPSFLLSVLLPSFHGERYTNKWAECPSPNALLYTDIFGTKWSGSTHHFWQFLQITPLKLPIQN